MANNKANKKPVGRPAGQVSNPKKIRKQFYITTAMNDKIKEISEHYEEYEAITLRRAVREFIDRFEQSRNSNSL